MRYEFLRFTAVGNCWVYDTQERKKKWISQNEMLEDILNDSIFDDIKQEV